MAEESTEIRCPVEGCDHAPFKTVQARDSHVRAKHPESLGEKGPAREVPIVEEDFAALLRKFKINADLAYNIAENISHTGGSTVFEDPDILLKRLTLWSTDIPPAKRKNIIEQWFAERQIDISPEIKRKAGMTTERIQEEEKKTQPETEVKYVFDDTTRQVRMAKEGERGGTMAQAKELKRMAEEDGKQEVESPFMQDGEGRWVLNPQARVTGVELMAVQFMQQSQAKGEPVDPITAMTQAAERWKSLREGLGVGASPSPAWMSDPAAFITMVRTIAPGKEEDSESKAALAAMQQTIAEMKEDKWRTQFEAQQTQIQNITGVLNKALEAIADVKKDRAGRSEMDILHEIATEGIGLAKSELPGLRKDIRDAVGSVTPPPGKTAEQREERKKQYKQAINNDAEIEDIGKRLFFSES